MDTFYNHLLVYFKRRSHEIENEKWEVKHSFVNRASSCWDYFNCFRGESPRINIVGKLTKPLFFTDEVISLEVEIDNSNGDEEIEEITATLR